MGLKAKRSRSSQHSKIRVTGTQLAGRSRWAVTWTRPGVKWAELEAKDKPADLKVMKAIFDRYDREIIPKKAPRTQVDNRAELKQLRPLFDEAPIDSITPSMIAGYRDARTAKVRANREIALLSHIFNMAREWGLTERENPCQGIRKNKETPRDYYANAVVWDAVYAMAEPELREAMDLGYLTGQRPADVSCAATIVMVVTSWSSRGRRSRSSGSY